jgi:nitroreductase
MSTQAISPQTLTNALHWRYATKSYDVTKKIPADVWKTLEQSLVLAPSSYGLQPYKFLVIENPAKRAELRPHSWNQPQITDASHLVVFAARTTLTEQHVKDFIQRTSEVRGVPAEALAGYRDMMIGDLVKGPRSAVIQHWAARQAYIALGELLTSAALLGVDATPIEGFSPADYDKALGLEGTGYSAVVVAALGYRSADDKYASLPKVRFAASQLVQTV